MFEYDKKKSETNELKHGVGLEYAEMLWNDPCLIIGPATSVVEERWAAVGKIEGKYWLAVFAYRGKTIRLITCRRAREEEITVYEQSN